MPELNQEVAAIPLQMLQMQQGIFQNALQDISDQEALTRANEQTNHMNWILGHVTTCRYMLANSMGLTMEDPNGKLYFQAIGDYDYNDLKTIEVNWLKISNQLLPYLEQLQAEDLAHPINDQGTSRLDILLFYIYHEAYHLGQIGILRKVLGLTPMKPY